MRNKKLIEIFTEEFLNHISKIRKFLNNFFENGQRENLTNIIKELHTLKGSAGILGYNELTQLFHKLENYFLELTKKEVDEKEKVRLVEIINNLEPIPAQLNNIEPIIELIDKLMIDESYHMEDNRKIVDEQTTEIQKEKIKNDGIEDNKVSELKSEFHKLSSHVYEILENLKVEGFIKNHIYEHLEKVGYKINRLNLTSFSIIDEKLKNIAYSTASKLGKKISFNIRNSNVEADYSIIMLVDEILTHLIRNAIFHGIETPDIRKKSGKSEKGNITVSYNQSADRIYIIVEDDGRGIDIKKVITKGVELKLIEEEEIESISKEDIYEIIFHESFSTTDEVDEISGRGMGLNIVKEKVSQTGGFISIESEVGKYTKFIINLPFTFKTIFCNVLSTGDISIGVPVSIIHQIHKYNPSNRTEMEGKILYDIEGKSYNLFKLSDMFHIEDCNEKLVVTFRNSKNALLVEKMERNILFDLVSIEGFDVRLKYYSGFSLYKDNPIAILNPVYIDSINITIDTPPLKTVNNKKNILVVDDNPVIRETVKDILTPVERFNIFLATNGAEAFEMTKIRQFHLIITDIDMPLMDGITLTKSIRKLNKATPIMILTSKGSDEDIKNGLDAGANAYFVKSNFNKELFLNKIEELI